MAEVNRLNLRDGRTLAYNIYGDPAGYPVFYFHGSPGSRLEGIHAHKPGLKHGIQVISSDRPGIGESDYHEKRTWRDWVTDVISLADHLGFERFSVMGASGGGPPTLACAYYIPDRLDSVADIGGWAPNLDGSLYDHLSPIERIFGKTVNTPVIFNLFYRVMDYFVKTQDGKTLLKNFQSSMGESDQRILDEDHDTVAFLAKDLKESFRQGHRGPAYDAILQYTDWGFKLEDIKIPVRIHHGTDDQMVPFEFSEAIHKRIPDSTLRSYPNMGHFSILYLIDEVISDLKQDI